MDEVSLTIAIASLGVAAVAVVVAFRTWRESRRQRQLAEELRKLTGVMVESLGYLAKSTKPPASSPRKPRPQVATQPPTSTSQSPTTQATLAVTVPTSPPPRIPTPAQQARLALATQREERKRLQLQLRQQQDQWKRQKDIAKAIGWVLDRIDSDQEEEE